MRIMVCSAVGLVVMAAACGGDPARGPAPAPQTHTSPTTTANSGEVIAEGVVAAGVEPGCLLLNTADEVYLLINANPTVAVPGQRVIVRGQPEPATVTTCQQGTPFVVREAKPAPT